MDEDDPREAIEELEARIESFAATIENCRKIMIASKIAILLGGALLVAAGFGFVSFDLPVMSAAIVTVLGGIVFLGSNRSTKQEAEDQLREAERERAHLIGQIDLRVVEGSRTLH